MKYNRILLKLSGESLMGKQSYGIAPEMLEQYGRDIKNVVEQGVEVAIVIGGGNIFRGLSGASKGMDRVQGDYMGMLATIINSMALQSELEKQGLKTELLGGLAIEPICKEMSRRRAIEAMQQGRVVIIGGGTGNPFFTTDTASTLRAIEIKADVILITHDHYDHYDEQAVSDLRKESTVIITNQLTAAALGDGEVMYNGDSLQVFDDLKIDAVAAYNTTPGHTQFHPKGRDNGFILTADGLRIYIAGDTEDIEEMKEVADIDIAFMPCNQPYTMTPDQLRHAAEMVRPRVLYPYHYGDTDPNAIIEALEGLDIDVRIRNFQ